MKKLSLLFAVLLFLPACDTIPNPFGSGTTTTSTTYAAANDPVVIGAEKTLSVSKDTFDLFFHIERDNEGALKDINPQIHVYAETLRRNAPRWLRTANSLKNTYKHSRNADNKASLLTALTTLTEATSQAQQYINQAHNRTP